jgi:pimeloyl-ACP methyl ester carboxylesterase
MSIAQDPYFRTILLVIVLSFFGFHGAAAQFRLEPAFPNEHMSGPMAAKGAIVWSHGRSVTSEDSLSPTPPYIESLQRAGWDAYRFNRMRDSDTLPDSARELVIRIDELKRQDYRQIVLAGQSFGAFLSLMAADASDDVHAVIATAPAAYGSFADFYESWENNATKLYPLLEHIRRARVMLFYFHGDDFDPGGRGERSEEVLAAHNIDHLVVDQPPQLTTHWAATTELFTKRFAGCIRNFIEANATDAVSCDASWGTDPGQQVAFPAHFHIVSAPEATLAAGNFSGQWHGFSKDGREVTFAIESVQGDKVSAIYSLGAGLRSGAQPARVRGVGQIVGDELVFKAKGINTLRYKLRADGTLEERWISARGKWSLDAVLHQTNSPASIAAPAFATTGAQQ